MRIVKCIHLDVMFVTNHLPFDMIGSIIVRSDRITVMCVMCRSVTLRL